MIMGVDKGFRGYGRVSEETMRTSKRVRGSKGWLGLQRMWEAAGCKNLSARGSHCRVDWRILGDGGGGGEENDEYDAKGRRLLRSLCPITIRLG